MSSVQCTSLTPQTSTPSFISYTNIDLNIDSVPSTRHLLCCR